MPTPLPSPSQLSSLLSSIRAPIFNTIHNPTNSRLGNKYLRRALRGPTMVEYSGQAMPSLKTLNSEGKQSPYAGWRVGWVGKKVIEVENVENPESEENMKNDNKILHPPPGEVKRESWSNGWLGDLDEHWRLEKVDYMKSRKKGPPKKGQGKRSQMKKR
ncbi:hypothetical protein TREMEDRAFT_56412 [Tremella mesenterica DSM 1558]|uniref:uncharacterized protein n=1 Tax=Tremella mesenterica (strain ATCC 24925 / CBS 8224 / DSM 1558 / NBRC 9311 / NRRL Y-6157 / RJB 2259-6 / UBC 559-6) TaxID=578456 RepID=UPI0003F49A7A|nr:uncharacterized protein TREMEDRAFT_56412 [Tremella mesenterica DSM 1558]EIW71365.1 hypothetical protein TREMEDRAFT_56412 [Tremella mesenterica DSM 1558]